MMKYVILALLFFVLSPGVLLTLPPIGKKWYMTGQTSTTAAIVHAIVFAVVLYALSYFGVFEGFEGSMDSTFDFNARNNDGTDSSTMGGQVTVKPRKQDSDLEEVAAAQKNLQRQQLENQVDSGMTGEMLRVEEKFRNGMR
jgi:hypothetical protein